MENFDRLVNSLIDSDAMKGCFIKELSNILDIPQVCIGDIWLETELNGGLASQVLKVELLDAEIPKERLMKLKFKSIYENCIVFEVGDVML